MRPSNAPAPTPLRSARSLLARARPSLLTLLTLLAIARPAFAQRASAAAPALSWVRAPGAEECVPPRELARAVELRLGRPVFVPASAAEVFVEGRVERTSEQGWVASVELRDAQGELLGVRRIHAARPSCRVLTEPLAVVIALMLDPEDLLVADPPAPRAPAAAARSSPPPPPSPPSAPRLPGSTWRFAEHAAVVVDVGSLPGFAVGAGFAASFTPPHAIPIEFRGAFWPERSARVLFGATAAMALFRGGIGACPRLWSRDRYDVGMCAGLEASWTQARGVGFDTSRLASAVALAITGAFRGTVTIAGPLFLGLDLGFALPLQRVRVEYDAPSAPSAAGTPVFESAPMSFVAALGLGLRSP